MTHYSEISSGVADKMFGGLAEAVEKALAKEVSLEFEFDGETVFGFMEVARDRMHSLRAQVKHYDLNCRDRSLKPCINPQKMADEIQRILCERHKLRHVPRNHAYMVLFIMYLLCKLEPPTRSSWWEKKFLENLPDYLELTDFFKDKNPCYRLQVIIYKFNSIDRLPLDLPPLVYAPYPKYPLLNPVSIHNTYLVLTQPTIGKMENSNCQQFYGTIKDSTF